MKENQSVLDMWENFMRANEETFVDAPSGYESWHFCDNEKDANELVQLVLKGEKRGTASLYKLYEIEDEKIPAVGELSILTDWNGIAQCVIKNKKVSILPFCEITKEHALIEGEGDKSLEYWRRAHLDAFRRELDRLGMAFAEDFLVVFEEFEVVYPSPLCQ